ncbi:hypothetical protein RclHR1_01210032 [Rhizophagus clarus]|uniref:Uncharacterized protein n=1 Tax=Rhizophagus clarus TaxID=94130 RepID=A0A2Z6QLC5_9GLOM|nr:hypothetical protein RclHR1_01210032 [Rhizophagus clarus]GES97667.1 hypothetical protein RCL_jg8825.t1 [Rhizophagus clarus]
MLRPPPPPPKKSSSMHRSLVPNKKGILNGRNNSSAPISDIRSGVNWNLRPYWNGQIMEWSQKLWLPIMTDSAALPSTSSSIYFPSIMQNSWFSSIM